MFVSDSNWSIPHAAYTLAAPAVYPGGRRYWAGLPAKALGGKERLLIKIPDFRQDLILGDPKVVACSIV